MLLRVSKSANPRQFYIEFITFFAILQVFSVKKTFF